ncbi:MAG: putative ral secretion pathway protein component of type secretion system [Pseudomonadota bacterium]|jgi:general secretion pathway protein L
MSTLIISLPLQATTAQTEFNFVVTDDGVSVARTGRARAEALPLFDKPGDVCIATAPLRALSWHQVTVPDGVTSSSARLRAVLEGLLEDKLLDEPGLLHFALPPTFQPGKAQWIAVCDRRWLAMAVQGLEAAQRPVSRVLPEWGPPAPPWHLHVSGTADDPQGVVCGDSGVGVFPLNTALLDGLTATDGISAEPALVALASQLLQRPVTPLSQAEHMFQLINSPWDLSKRLQMRNLASRGKLEWLQAPRWRFVRWAAVVLIAVNLLGLNALAWVEQHQLMLTQDAMQAVLRRNFPSVKTVVDAPVQMAREVRLLEQASAAPSALDLDVMLGALSRTLPAGQTLQSLDYANGQLRVSGLELNSNEARALTAGVQANGYSASPDGVTWLMQPTASAVGRP